MIRDNFEEQLGRILREAEAAPPEGSWDFIQSKIGKVGFSFPHTAVMVIAVVMLGSLAVYDSVRPLSENQKEAAAGQPAQRSETEEPRQFDSPQTFAEAPIRENDKANNVERSSEEFSSEGAETSEVPEFSNDPEKADDISLPEEDRSVESNLPITVSAPALLQEEVEENATTQESPSEVAEESPELRASISGETTCHTPCKLTLEAHGNADQYIWDAGVYGVSESEILELKIDEPTEFTVFLTARNESGTEVVTSTVVEIEKGSTLYVPNSFSPNGDGFNDEFRVKGSEIESFSMSIINSKGRVIFKTDYLDEPWIYDASLHDLENEKYIAVVRAVGKDGKVHSFNQPLTIIP